MESKDDGMREERLHVAFPRPRNPSLGLVMSLVIDSLHKNTFSEPNAQQPSHEEKQSVILKESGNSFTLRARIQFFSLCWTLFLAGWSDGSTGPLLPRIQSNYHVLLSPPQAWCT